MIIKSLSSEELLLRELQQEVHDLREKSNQNRLDGGAVGWMLLGALAYALISKWRKKKDDEGEEWKR